METLSIPPLEIDIRGDLSITGNAAAFRAAVTEYLARINLKPTTGAEFGAAVDQVKTLKAAEDEIKERRESALRQAGEINFLLEILDPTSEDCRKARLALTKAIDAERDRRRAEAIDAAVATLPPAARDRFRVRVENAGRGKKTAATYQEAVAQEAGLILDSIEASRAKIAAAIEAHGETMIPDAEKLELESVDFVANEIERRLERRAAEGERAKLKAEADAARAEAAAAKAAPAPAPAPAPEPEPTVKNPLTVPAPEPPREMTEREEAEALLRTIAAAFGPVKTAREALRHQSNQLAADEFASGLKPLWQRIKAQLQPAPLN